MPLGCGEPLSEIETAAGATMHDDPQFATIATPHKVEVLFSRDLLRAAPDTLKHVAADRGIPEWVKPRICGHDRSPSVHYTWEWTSRETVHDA